MFSSALLHPCDLWSSRRRDAERIRRILRRNGCAATAGLSKHGYGPDLQDEAAKTVLAQAELRRSPAGALSISKAELAPLAAISPNGNGNRSGNGSLAVSRLS